MNYNRMTIRESAAGFEVFKMKPAHAYAGCASGGGYRKTTFAVSKVAKPLFCGSYAECAEFIQMGGAEFMSEHGLPV